MLLYKTKTNSKEEFTEGHSAYFDSAMIEGQEPALKGIMRTLADIPNKNRSKIDFKTIGCLRMRLNYQNSSNFGSHYACLWHQLLHRHLSPLVVKIYIKGYSMTETLLNAFRTCYKRVSLFIKSRAVYATGEVSYSTRLKRDGRGFVVPILLIGKGPKHFTKTQFVRSHVTRSGMSSLAPVRLFSSIPVETPKGLKILAKHWQTCYQNPNRIFYDLRGILKQESIWFAAYLKLKSNNGSFTQGPDEDDIDSLTKKRILELREAVLKNKFS